MTKPLERNAPATTWAVEDFHSGLGKKQQLRHKSTEANSAFALPRECGADDKRGNKAREVVGVCRSVVGAA